MRLLIDEMWSSTIAEQLRLRGFDVAAVAERVDLRSEPDAVILAVAINEHRVVVTENVGDFRFLTQAVLERGESHPGLILTTNRRFPRHDPHIIGRMVAALSTLMEDDPDLTNREYWLL